MILFPNDFLKGTVEITDNLQYCRELIYTQPADLRIVIVSEEENTLSPRHPNVLKGTNLLPPIEAQMAEVDGLRDKYYAVYGSHLEIDPFNREYIMALITFIHRGGTVVFYFSDIKLFFVRAFLEIISASYGINIPVAGTGILPVYNYNYLSLWLSCMYMYGTIDAIEFVANFPIQTEEFAPEIVDLLVMHFGIYGTSYEEVVRLLKEFCMKIKQNPMIQNALVPTSYEMNPHFNMVH